MNEKITPNDLVLLAYNELEPKRKQQVLAQMSVDPDLRLAYSEIADVQSVLDTYSVQPDNTSLQIILEESSSAMEVL